MQHQILLDTGKNPIKKITQLVSQARKDDGVGATCIYALFRGDPDDSEEWVNGIVGAVLLDDIRRELKAIRVGLSRRGR